MCTVSFGPSTRKLPVPADTAFSKISMLRNGIILQTEVSASPTFFGWVFGFNGKVQILAPESVKEQYRQMIAQADEGMQQKENKRIVN